MQLVDVLNLVEMVRRETIGDPIWIPSKHVYEFGEQSPKVVAVLKLIRAAQGVKSMEVLCSAGLFIDFGMVARGVDDAIGEIYFLMEEYPKISSNVDQFVKAFFESNIEDYLSSETNPIPSKKIRSARVRYLTGRNDQETADRFARVFKTFSGYVHANYAHIMEIYSGDFNLVGVPSIQQKVYRSEHASLAMNTVLYGAGVIAEKLQRHDLFRLVMQMLKG